jgi:6,7-dimethyl-8-ribityllumazine synthase
MKLGIVVSEYYWEEIMSKMLELAIQTCQIQNIEYEIIKVPGCFDIPLPVKRFLQKDGINGVITLGSLIQGQTDHDSVIAYALTKTLQELSLEFNKPVVLGVNGPKMSKEQAIARIGRAEKVTQACIKLCNL